MLLVYLVIAVSHLKMRKKMGKVEQQNLKVKMWLFPYVTYVTIAAIIAVLVAMFAIDTLRSQALLTMFVTVLIILSYFIFNRNKNSTVLNPKSKNEESVRF
ncbi:Gamma-aminobutyrate permease [Streptococcus pneumoniae]|nr:Gamma-aminobutyrate permease [Streptococcus pneumoniae]